MQAKYLLFFRAVILDVLLLQAAYAPEVFVHWRWLWTLFPLYAAYAVAFYLLRARLPGWLSLGSFLGDIAMTTAILHFSQGISNDLYIAYFLVILASCFMESLAYSFVVGFVACAVYAAMAFPATAAAESPVYLLRTSLLLITSFFSTYVVNAVKRIERDTSERYEKKLASMQRLSLVGQALAGVLHEVKTPINTVILSVEYARELQRRDAAADVSEPLEMAVSEAERAGAIIAEHLSLVRPTELALAPLPVQRPLRGVIDTMKRRMDERGVALEADLGPEAWIAGSERHLYQVFANLFLNAIEAMPLGGRLAVAVRRTSGEVRVSVADTGVGIPRELQARLFEPFSTSRAESGGHGLGLSVVRWIVQKHKGDIRLSSDGPGKGTTAVVIFPAAPKS